MLAIVLPDSGSSRGPGQPTGCCDRARGTSQAARRVARFLADHDEWRSSRWYRARPHERWLAPAPSSGVRAGGDLDRGCSNARLGLQTVVAWRSSCPTFARRHEDEGDTYYDSVTEVWVARSDGRGLRRILARTAGGRPLGREAQLVT